MRRVESKFIESSMEKICDDYCRFPLDSSLSTDSFDTLCNSCFIVKVFENLVGYPPYGREVFIKNLDK